MNEWVREGFFVIKSTVVASDGFKSEQPLMEKISADLHALLIWKTYKNAEYSITNNLDDKTEYLIVKEDFSFYEGLQDDFKKHNLKVALKLVEEETSK